MNKTDWYVNKLKEQGRWQEPPPGLMDGLGLTQAQWAEAVWCSVERRLIATWEFVKVRADRTAEERAAAAARARYDLYGY